MDIALVAAGSLALVGTAIHGLGGELLVVRRLSLDALPATRFGSPRTTLAMIRAAWHMATAAFLAVGCALLVAGTVLDGDAARAVAVVAATVATGFAAVVVVLGGAALSPQGLLRHPGPLTLTAIAALAWLGAL